MAISASHTRTRFLTAFLSQERKLLTCIVVLLATILLVLAGSIAALFFATRSQSALNETYTRNLLLARDLRDQKHEQIGLVPMFVITGDEALRRRLTRADQTFADTLSTLRARTPPGPSRTILDDVGELQGRLLAIERDGLALRAGGAPIDVVNTYFRTHAGPASERMVGKIRQFADIASSSYLIKKESNSRLLTGTFIGLSAASLLCLLIVVAVTVLLIREQERRGELEAARKRDLQREQEVSRARKEAVEVVSHDLRSPLTAIIFASEMLQDAHTERPGRESTLIRTMFTSAHSMYQMINNLLDHAKIESGSLQLNRERVDVRALVDKVDARFQLVAARKQVGLVNDVSPGALNAEIDEVRIEQVLSNLIGNALKFTQAGGEVRISSDVGDDAVELHISDTGMGMTQEQAARTFDRYWQAKETASLGSGLGLAISKAIVDAHQGQISVQSTPGEGSVFSVRLPLVTA